MHSPPLTRVGTCGDEWSCFYWRPGIFCAVPQKPIWCRRANAHWLSGATEWTVSEPLCLLWGFESSLESRCHVSFFFSLSPSLDRKSRCPFSWWNLPISGLFFSFLFFKKRTRSRIFPTPMNVLIWRLKLGRRCFMATQQTSDQTTAFLTLIFHCGFHIGLKRTPIILDYWSFPYVASKNRHPGFPIIESGSAPLTTFPGTLWLAIVCFEPINKMMQGPWFHRLTCW